MTEPLLADASPYSRVPPAAWRQLSGNPGWFGVGLKATEGLGGTGDWFAQHWPAVAAAGAGRELWVRMAYHFLIVKLDGRAQAEHTLRTLERAGGWTAADLISMDVEEGSGNAEFLEPRGPGPLIAAAHAFADTIHAETGRAPVLYCGWWWRSMARPDRLGCDLLWWSAFTRTLPAPWYQQIGWTTEQLLLWQWDGSSGHDGVLPGYPTRAPIEHGEDVDISVLTLPGGLDALRRLLWAESPASEQ